MVGKFDLFYLYANQWPPLVFQEQTRRDIPAWDALLFLYGIILVPMIFVLLVGLNLLVWSRSRINYVFIFGKIS